MGKLESKVVAGKAKPRGKYPHIKRAVDCAVSCALLLVLSPIFLAVSALILCVDGRPVFYKQKRVGYLCREFMIWKFRTMERTAEADGPFTSARGEDNRITFLGRLLRRFRLDELPQLWNVVLGDMALVGPRPEWIREVEVLGMVIPNYNLRYLVPPGITGWAQIYFRATNNYKDSIEKLHYDLFYLKYFSAALDLSILLKTVKRMFVKDARMPSLPAFAPRPIEAKHHWARDFNALGKTAPKPPDKPFPWQETLASLLFLGLFRR